MIRTINIDVFRRLIVSQYNPGDILLVLCDASGGAFPITLPDAASLRDVLICVKKTDSSANAVTVNTVASQTIDGADSITLESQYESEILITDAANYYRFGNIRYL